MMVFLPMFSFIAFQYTSGMFGNLSIIYDGAFL